MGGCVFWGVEKEAVGGGVWSRLPPQHLVVVIVGELVLVMGGGGGGEKRDHGGGAPQMIIFFVVLLGGGEKPPLPPVSSILFMEGGAPPLVAAVGRGPSEGGGLMRLVNNPLFLFVEAGPAVTPSIFFFFLFSIPVDEAPLLLFSTRGAVVISTSVLCRELRVFGTKCTPRNIFCRICCGGREGVYGGDEFDKGVSLRGMIVREIGGEEGGGGGLSRRSIKGV